MKDQHTKIKGYRDLTQEEINTMNSIKEHGENLRKMLWDMKTIEATDKRWVAIAETHLQQGIMAAVRAVAKPDSF